MFCILLSVPIALVVWSACAQVNAFQQMTPASQYMPAEWSPPGNYGQVLPPTPAGQYAALVAQQGMVGAGLAGQALPLLAGGMSTGR